MLSKGKSKTAAEKAWLETVVNFAHESNWLNKIYDGFCERPNVFQIDHLLGAQAKRKINYETVRVGEFVIMPIPVVLHDLTSNHPLNRTLNPAAYRDMVGHEIGVWLDMIENMEHEGIEIPFSSDLVQAVIV